MHRLIAIAALLILPTLSFAQPQVETLGKCLADSTSGKDRKDLARWIFLSMAAHPEIKQHASPSAASAADDSSRVLGALFTRLLTESCSKETRSLVSVAGPSSIQYAFQTLGQLAMQELMTDKAVSGQMSMFERYTDQKKIADVLGGK